MDITVEEGVQSAVSVRDAGARGGRATFDRHGVEFYRVIGKKGGQRTAQLYAAQLRTFGKKGGRPRRPALDENEGEGHPETKGG